MTGDVTFSFGQNWQSLVADLSPQRIESARADIVDWLGADGVRGKRVLDIGCGSGIHALAMHGLGAAEIVSFDYDPRSVAATRDCHKRVGCPQNWRVFEGSVLDKPMMENLGSFDIVYSWGVLHHTGKMWEAIDNALDRVTPGGTALIALYAAGPRYTDDLAVKRAYNAGGSLTKRVLEWRFISYFMYRRLRAGKNPFGWNEKTYRGMDVYHDIVDWLGGLPYEVVYVEEFSKFASERGFSTLRTFERGEGGCHIFFLAKENITGK
jgi:SAM-dependent methyltransferase